MKKILLSFVLLLGGVLFANAQTSLSLFPGWGTSIDGFPNPLTGDVVFYFKNNYATVNADITTEINISEYPSFEIVLADDAPVGKLQIHLKTDKGEKWTGAINTKTYKKDFIEIVAAGSTKVTELDLQACDEADLGKVEIKAWNLVKGENKTPLGYKMKSADWVGGIISPSGNIIKFTGGEQYNDVSFYGAEGLYFPRFRFTISTDEFPSVILKINIKTTEQELYKTITPGTATCSLDVDMTTGEKITKIRIFADETYTPFSLKNVSATIQEVAPVEIGEYEWATFVSDKALDFTGSDIKAYAVTGHSGTAITKSDALTKVPANTPLLLNAAKGSYNIPVISTASAIGTNLLKAGTGSAISKESGKTKYVLGVTDGKAQFQKINATAATVPTGKAYLEFNEVIEARSLDFDDEGTTAIKNMKVGENDNIYYDLQGRRVLYPKNGLYIVNGKKVILK